MGRITRSWMQAAAIALALAGVSAATAGGQAATEVTVQVVSGEPFGVGRITVRLPPATPDDVPRDSLEFISCLRLRGKGGAALYPAFEARPTGAQLADARHHGPKGEPPGAAVVAERIRRLPSEITAHFLFRGKAPTALTLIDAHGEAEAAWTASVKPAADGEAHRRMLGKWWHVSCEHARRAAVEDHYPPTVDTYLLGMLSRRLKLEMPDIHGFWYGGEALKRVTGLLIGAESIRVAMQRKTLLKDADARQTPDQPLPKAVAPPPVPIPKIKGAVAIEPIAFRVPQECFYLRCGSFKNFSWMRRFIDTWGARLRDHASSRGVDYEVHKRLERQLALRETALARLLGDKVVSDVAVIGTDTFIREGAAIGILFQAKVNDALAMQIERQRNAARKADKAAREISVTIAGREVSLLATPDNTVRSFYVADGDYHLVTTSRVLVRRFLEAGAGKGSLAKTSEFRYARRKMPLKRNDTLFIYLSDPFFRNIVAPQYRVEMTRRMRSLAKMELVHLARLAAAPEGRKARTIEDLVAAGLLPPRFQDEPDGSRLVLAGDRVIDTLRGARGAFLPVPDVSIKAVTRAEAEAYQEFARHYRRAWERMDPAIIGIRHIPKTAAGTERVVMDLYLTPYARRHYDFLESFLGRADFLRIGPVPGNLVSAQLVFKDESMIEEDSLSLRGMLKNRVKRILRQRQRVYAGLQDFAVPLAIVRGKIEADEEDMAADHRGYAGETPKEKLLGFVTSMLDEKKATAPDAQGYRKIDDGVWKRDWGGFHTVAAAKATLAKVTPALKLVSAERKAQLRVEVADLSASKAAEALHAAGYLHARKLSGGNVHLMHALIRQMGAAPADAKRQAERILGARLVCPLGGRYRRRPGAAGTWRSDSPAWQAQLMHHISALPAGYRFDAVDWFKGLRLELSLNPAALSLRTHVELDMKPEKPNK